MPNYLKKEEKPGWAAIVPYYNSYVLVEIAGLNWWYFLIAIAGSVLQIVGINTLTPIAGIAGMVVNFFIFYNLGKRFKKDPMTYAILGLFFSPIMVMILGFGSSIYDSSIAVSPNGPIGDDKNSNTTPSDERYCLGCGKKLTPGTKFCENCGKSVEDNTKIEEVKEEPTIEEPKSEEVKPEVIEETKDEEVGSLSSSVGGTEN